MGGPSAHPFGGRSLRPPERNQARRAGCAGRAWIARLYPAFLRRSAWAAPDVGTPGHAHSLFLSRGRRSNCQSRCGRDCTDQRSSPHPVEILTALPGPGMPRAAGHSAALQDDRPLAGRIGQTCPSGALPPGEDCQCVLYLVACCLFIVHRSRIDDATALCRFSCAGARVIFFWPPQRVFLCLGPGGQGPQQPCIPRRRLPATACRTLSGRFARRSARRGFLGRKPLISVRYPVARAAFTC